MAATTGALCRCASIQSSNGMPTIALGRIATTTFSQSMTVSILNRQTKPSPFFGFLNGQSFEKYSTTTARIAPSWMTTSNMDLNASVI